MPSGGGNTTTVQKAEPWAPIRPQLIEAAGVAGRLFENDRISPRPYTGNRVAGFTPMQNEAFGMATDAMRGPTASGAARSSLIDMMQGSDGIYRDLDAVRADIMGSVVPAAAAQFSQNGMTDSGVAMEGVSRAATQAIAPFEYDAFNNAQQNQLRAAAMAPGLDQAAFMPAQMGMQFGGMRQAMNQAQIDANMGEYYERANRPFDELSRYSNLLLGYGGQGGQTSATQPGAGLGSQLAGAGMLGLGTYGLATGALGAGGLGLSGPVGLGLGGLMALGSLF